MEEFPGKDGRVPEIRTVAMARDANLSGDIFGGWVLSQMDLAAETTSRRRANGRVATVAIEAMAFHSPVFIGDIVSCFTKILGIGRTSLTIHVETWSERLPSGEAVKVTEGNFVMVAIGDDRRPREVPPA
jgi:acyl-CoA thioesterase YciA